MGDAAGAPPPAWHALVAGASSACVSRLITYPPDTVKSRLQVQGSAGAGMVYRSTLDAFAKIGAREGLPGFYRGFGGILLTVIPANMCYFSGYEFGRRVAPRSSGLAADLTAALIAQTVAGVAFCPIDIVKQRVQTHAVLHPGGSSFGPLAAMREVYAAAGVPGFFKGYWAMTWLWAPWNVLYISMYEASKRRVYRWQLERLHAEATVTETPEGIRLVQDLPMLQVLPLWSFPLCSALCSATASVLTHPIDVVKTRLQVLANRGGSGSGGGGGGGVDAPRETLTAWRVCRQLYAQEGLHGFTRGMGARVATMATGSAVTWMTYESCKRWLGRWQQGQGQQLEQQQGQPQKQLAAAAGSSLEQGQAQQGQHVQQRQQGAPR